MAEVSICKMMTFYCLMYSTGALMLLQFKPEFMKFKHLWKHKKGKVTKERPANEGPSRPTLTAQRTKLIPMKLNGCNQVFTNN